MTLLGLDFDNTIVRYDNLFHKLAVTKGLIQKDFAADKIAIRNYLREQGMDREFTLLQGEAYGLRILDAEPAVGMIKTLKKLKKKGIEMTIVSHKTKYPYKGPQYNLQEKAVQWLEKHEFFKANVLNWQKRDIHFEATKEMKLKKIQELECDYFVDDLPDVIEEVKNQTTAVPILYDPDGKHVRSNTDIINAKNWEQIIEIIIER